MMLKINIRDQQHACKEYYTNNYIFMCDDHVRRIYEKEK